MAAGWRSRLGAILGPGPSGPAGQEDWQPTGEPAPRWEPRGSAHQATPAVSTAASAGPEAHESGDLAQSSEAGEPVLIVDDDADWCKECAFSLARMGYDPLIAPTASDAMDLFMEHDIAIAIVDYQLPELDGISLIYALAREAEAQGRSLHFLLATGHATKDVAIDALRASVVDILEKPVSQADLRGALQRIKGLRPTPAAREVLLNKISGLSAELHRLAQLMDDTGTPKPREAPAHVQGEGDEREVSSLNAYIRELLRRETKRREIGGGELFGDPTWAMLLDLLLAKIEDRRVSVSSACIASGAPMSTALRLVRRLVGEEVLCRIPDEQDRRRHFLIINPRFEQPLLDYLSEQFRQADVAVGGRR